MGNRRHTPRPGLRRRFTRGLCALGAATSGLLLALGFFLHAGLGLDPNSNGWGPQRALAEVTTVRGGLLLVINGTRTDSIDGSNAGSSSTGVGPLYLLVIDRVEGPLWLYPAVRRYAPWSGPYLYFPLWPAAPLLLGAFHLLRPQTAPGTCPQCGYSRAGLARDAVCPECRAPDPLGDAIAPAAVTRSAEAPAARGSA